MTERHDLARGALRAATAQAHERLDARFGVFDLGDRGEYGRFLAAHAAALPPVERALDAAGMTGLLDDWPARRRAHLIARDLAALGLPLPAPVDPPAIADAAAAWGAAYVVEGSRLGGAMLARRVPAGLPTAYLATPLPPGAWRKFLATLENALYSEAMLSAATDTALATFASFALAADRAAAR